MGSTRVLFKAEHSTCSQLSSLFAHLFDFFLIERRYAAQALLDLTVLPHSPGLPNQSQF